ncbi:hypothetical protein [Paenibacillus antarcticus]|nr:hypothetical protein [Paenibacillus antarcticus]
MSVAKYNLFLRNWVNNQATVEQIEKAVTLGHLAREEADTIMGTERNTL